MRAKVLRSRVSLCRVTASDSSFMLRRPYFTVDVFDDGLDTDETIVFPGDRGTATLLNDGFYEMTSGDQPQESVETISAKSTAMNYGEVLR